MKTDQTAQVNISEGIFSHVAVTIIKDAVLITLHNGSIRKPCLQV